jgi:hypothetical protein
MSLEGLPDWVFNVVVDLIEHESIHRPGDLIHSWCLGRALGQVPSDVQMVARILRRHKIKLGQPIQDD